MDTSTADIAADDSGPSPRHRAWMAAAALLVAAGIAASVVSAQAVGHADSDRSQEEFKDSSAEVASTLQLAIQHDNDLVVDAGGLLADPALSQTAFLRWASAARVVERYPEMTGLAVLELVLDADLPAFAAQAQADPTGPLSPDGRFEVVPPGPRPYYCLLAATVVIVPLPDPPPVGYDYCSDTLVRSVLLGARDSGEGAYLPYPSGGKNWLGIQTPIYYGGVVPDTVAARREAFAGVVATQLDPAILLERALRLHPELAVELSYDEGLWNVEFTSGVRPEDAATTTTDFDSGWTVRTFGTVESPSITSGAALRTLLAGVTLSTLLATLLFILGTGRERARRQLFQRTRELHHQALHDALTGLPNRALVMDRIDQMLARDRRHQTSSALLFVDLDNFKSVNDTLGHGAGDLLLIRVAERLSNTLRGVDTIGRMGGDEFVVLIDGTELDVAPALVAQRLLDVMRQPFELGEGTLPLSVNVSIGVAIGARDHPGDLLRDADVALYQAKAAGKNRFEVFDPDMQSNMARRSDLEFDLRTALAAGELRLVYQSIYELESNTVVAVEALLRWDHPERGEVGPEEFIPILEQTGQIREVGQWVLRTACAQMAAWHSLGEDGLSVSVNVSARQLDSDGIVEDIRVALLESGLPAACLIIEVTETALTANVEATARRLQDVRELGVKIAVDDFGTGYSSLAYLQQFPVDCLKIDRVFTSALTTSPESQALVGTLVQLGKDLGLTTLAEGVETTDEMDLVRETKVNQVQGFLMARPLDPQTLETQFLGPHRLSPKRA